MPIVRLSRDKRGLDTLYLIDTRTDGRRSGGARVLYFWTAPPGLRVGREPLDTSRQRELERTHPDVDFDWPELLKAVDAVRQQAAAVLTPEARREAWRGAGRPSKPGQRQSARSGEAGVGVAVSPSAPTPVPEAVHESAFVPDVVPAAAPAPTGSRDDASKAADSSGPRSRRRRRRSRRPGDSSETPQPADPIIES